MSCCKCCKKRRNSETKQIVVESIATLTPCHNDQNRRLKELEVTFNEIISQLNSHYDFKVKTPDEALQNIYSLVLYTAKKYDMKPNT